MSANRWSQCPQCRDNKIRHIEELTKEMEASYGKVPITEFESMRNNLETEKLVLANPKDSFREDWELYHENGVVFLDYGGSCTVCGLIVEWSDTKEFYKTPVGL